MKDTENEKPYFVVDEEVARAAERLPRNPSADEIRRVLNLARRKAATQHPTKVESTKH